MGRDAQKYHPQSMMLWIIAWICASYLNILAQHCA